MKGSVILLPPTLGGSEMEIVLEQLAAAAGPVTLDGRGVRSAHPYAALTAELAAGQAGGQLLPWRRRGLAVPYRITLIRPREIAGEADVFHVIDHAQETAGRVLVDVLGRSRAEAAIFSMLLSELLQNVVEHAEAPGRVAVWTLPPPHDRTIGVGIVDGGIGFAGSLGMEKDEDALNAALLWGRTRLSAPGRGQGLRQVRRQVGRWGGEVLVRSGSALFREQGDQQAISGGLARVAGVQIGLTLPPAN